MANYQYPATIESNGEGGFIASFRDVPEAITEAWDLEELKNKEVVVVEFWAPWCGYCKRLAPVLKTVAKDIDIMQVNIDDFEELSESYRVETIPTLLVLRNGIASEPLIAPQAKSLITDWLKDNQVL